eukprot:TRINITY_DN363_c0_g1_i1.p1 TRINITY_DN363_c0_g1~~TRINITY_DN363_c0_g1_i1.p1  ORF type:complete len:222 (+),score=37.29 TRINITY_DN363_c0_g1_i1:108-773(+)
MSSITTKVENPKKEFLFKILVVGDVGTGKTSLIQRYVHSVFSDHYKSTIGVDFALKEVNWDGSTTVRVQLWDIAGQERFGSMTRVYYREAMGALIVFDVTRYNTFESVKTWKQDIDTKLTIPGTDIKIPVLLVANKKDLLKSGSVKTEGIYDLDEFVKNQDFKAWYETSAKKNENVDDVIKRIVKEILKIVESSDFIAAKKVDEDHGVKLGEDQAQSKCSC